MLYQLENNNKTINMLTQKNIRISGILAVTGGLLNAFSDLLLRSGSVSGKEITLEYMSLTTPYTETLWGAVLGGLLAIPLWFFILIPLYMALKSAGKWFVFPVIIFFAYNILLTAIYHTVYALYSAGYNAYANAGHESLITFEEMIHKFTVFKDVLSYSWFVSIVIGSIWLLVTIVFKNTCFKRSAIFALPMFSMLASYLSTKIPAPIGGYIAPMAGTLVFVVFFIVTLLSTWNISISKK